MHANNKHSTDDDDDDDWNTHVIIGMRSANPRNSNRIWFKNSLEFNRHTHSELFDIN